MIRTLPITAAIAALVIAAGCGASAKAKPESGGDTQQTEQAKNTEQTENAEQETMDKPEKTEEAIFAAGCFWGIEHNYQKMDGVIDAVSGYTGGHVKNPSYKQVCSDSTGHAEAVRVEYDPEKISFDELLDAFWKMHDPTQVNRQGPDIGSQYRSAIFYKNEEQKKAAEESKKKLELEDKFGRPIATEITEATEFYPAEDYHQDYIEKKGGHGSGSMSKLF